MHYADYKTILSPHNNMNLYRGCTHGCIYCDARSKCYQITHDFEDIEVKRNAAEILEAQLLRRRRPGIITTGSMCDPYLPLEKSLRLTRRCLELIERYGFGLSILTKSALITRDTDILKAINEQTKCVVQMTLTTYDERLCKILEPRVSTTLERVRALEAMREAGIPTVVWFSPVLPFINDTEENLRGILSHCARAGVRGIISFGFGVTLREGDREYFYANLDRHFPGVKERYIREFGNSYECLSPNNARLTELFRSLCGEYGITCDFDSVSAYLNKFERKECQLSLF
ncbi:MAG: radical SAM protein [Oscillospiraceae bacterium]|jgi:DNA repair photolyase|nr:radical SAM protein [Oscillospiraceae bacterium]